VSRACYSDDLDNWALIRWRGAVASAIRGKRGQAFLREMLTALDALPEKRLIPHELEQYGEVCALGSVGKLRGMDMSQIDPEEYEQVATAFGIPECLAREIEFENDDCYSQTPEDRYAYIYRWVERQLKPATEKGVSHD
jgi:hypothetical protein